MASHIPLPATGSSALPLWKRCFDLTGCLIALPFVVVVGAGLALWIQLVSSGSVFFKQERIGYRGNPFLLFKFRTMRVDADGATHRAHSLNLMRSQRPMQKLDATRDDRLIPGGWLLRASGADELPQLINVLLGDMSLVGPRPCVRYEYDRYTDRHRQRLASAPGLTGLWQVSGKNRTTFDEMIELDIRYGETRSLALDLIIALKTLPALGRQIADTFLSRRRQRAEPAVSPIGSTPAADQPRP